MQRSLVEASIPTHHAERSLQPVPHPGSEAQEGLLSSSNVLPVQQPAGRQAEGSSSATADTGATTEDPEDLQRVASLDFLRAFLDTKGDVTDIGESNTIVNPVPASAVETEGSGPQSLLQPQLSLSSQWHQREHMQQMQQHKQQLEAFLDSQPTCSSVTQLPPLALLQQQGSAALPSSGGLTAAQAHALAQQQVVLTSGHVPPGMRLTLAAPSLHGCALPGQPAGGGPGASAAVAADLMPAPFSPGLPGRGDHGTAPSASVPSSATAPSEGGAGAKVREERRMAAAAPPAAMPPAAASSPTSTAPSPRSELAEVAANAGKGSAKVVVTNPEGLSKQELRRMRRMISNRESARRSRKRKQEQLGELEEQLHRVQAQLAETTATAVRMAEQVSVRDAQILALRHELESMRHVLLMSGHGPVMEQLGAPSM